MQSATSALYEPLIERDLAAIPEAAAAFANAHSDEELWIVVTRFAVLAYAPSQHGKRAVLACRAAWDLRDAVGARWRDWLVECARYAAASRQPWSEPPILDLPALEAKQPRELAELHAAVDANDRPRAERWLAARLDDALDDLRATARGDARLMLDTVGALEEKLGSKGRFALLRMVVHELFVESEEADASLDVLVDRAIEERGSIESVRNVFVAAAREKRGPGVVPTELAPYELARDYAQTLIAHSIAHTLPRAAEFLAAVHHNLEEGESYSAWSFA